MLECGANGFGSDFVERDAEDFLGIDGRDADFVFVFL